MTNLPFSRLQSLCGKSFDKEVEAWVAKYSLNNFAEDIMASAIAEYAWSWPSGEPVYGISDWPPHSHPELLLDRVLAYSTSLYQQREVPCQDSMQPCLIDLFIFLLFTPPPYLTSTCSFPLYFLYSLVLHVTAPIYTLSTCVIITTGASFVNCPVQGCENAV